MPKLFEGSNSLKFLQWIGRVVPQSAGRKFARQLGGFYAGIGTSPMIQSVRENQNALHDGRLNPEEINTITRQVFMSKGVCLFDYFYYLTRPDELLRVFALSDSTKRAVDAMRQGAVIAVAPHMSNFDMAGHLLSLLGITVQALSYPSPNANYSYHNQLRDAHGMRTTPISPQALRDAKNTLRLGGTVVTGIDRPVESASSQKYLLEFCGKPARLPVIHTRLALETDTPVVLLSVFQHEDLSYELKSSPLLTMTRGDDKATEIVQNSETVLRYAEAFIREAPNQWHMFYPVWPEQTLRAGADPNA